MNVSFDYKCTKYCNYDNIVSALHATLNYGI